jgi:hypothetical protein
MNIQIRSANRYREKLRPSNPVDLELKLDERHTPSKFIWKDIRRRHRRHLVFATQTQLTLLSRAKTWYVDGTFTFVRHPFVQLWSVHAFVKAEGVIRQISLAFALMSSRQKKDYKLVIGFCKPSDPPHLKRFNQMII